MKLKKKTNKMQIQNKGFDEKTEIIKQILC